jgi:UDP-3-O-[3-hydroxymyristoyl] glucosamine N-acyltransferase
LHVSFKIAQNEAWRALVSKPFFCAVEKSLADIVACAGAEAAEGTDLSLLIRGVAPLDEAGPGELSFLDLPQDAALLQTSHATACFVAPRHAPLMPQSMLALIIEEPFVGIARAMCLLYPQATGPNSSLGTAGVNPGASLHPEARLEQHVIIDPGAVIGPRVEIGSGSIVGANSVIAADVRIGRNCLVSPQVTLSHALIGDRVILHPGVRIGQRGVSSASQHRTAKLPWIGRVIIQDGVEIGANSTIDRGVLGDTVLGEETKIANLVHIAENVTLGRYSTVAAQAQIPPGARHTDFFSFPPE